MNKFRFHPSKHGKIGIERECFLVDAYGALADAAPQVLSELAGDPRFTYELPRFQIETRAYGGPLPIEDVESALAESDEKLKVACKVLDLNPVFQPVWDKDPHISIYPDKDYEKLASMLPDDVIRAASRVCGLHVHIGMKDHETALAAYNNAVLQLKFLLALGDFSEGERLKHYLRVVPNPTPQRYESWEALYEEFRKHGFDITPRRCWWFIRFSELGSIEFRMFDTTDNFKKVVEIAEFCREICAGI